MFTRRMRMGLCAPPDAAIGLPREICGRAVRAWHAVLRGLRWVAWCTVVGRRRLLPRGPQTPPVGRVACLAILLFCTLSAVGAGKKSDLTHGAVVDMRVTIMQECFPVP